jgi:cobalt-zinc-cadmium efflux system membrane fusion protein
MKFKESVLIALFPLALACASAEDKKPPAPEPAFRLSDAILRDLQLDTVRSGPVQSQLNLTGKVAAIEDHFVKVSPLVDGVIERLTVNLGDFVQQGQVLATLRSVDVADVENQINQAKSDLLSAEKNLDVTEDLAKSGLAAAKDVVLARNEVQKNRSALQKAQSVSGIYGIHNSRYSLKAPITGYVIEKNVNISEQMQYHEGETGPFYTIANLNEVQVQAFVYESDIAKIKLGQNVDVRLVAFPDRVFKGKVDKYSNVLDPATRTMMVRIHLDNKDLALKPEMFAKITVNVDGNYRLMYVPSEALIFDKNKNFVLVYHDPQHIETREVQVSQNTSGRAYIASGLKAGEVVMTKNQLLVYNALNN